MTTWGTLLTNIRNDLQDTASTPRWSNATLYMYTCDAIRDYSVWFPKRVDQASLTLSGTSYPLPADFVEDITVESPVDTFLERRDERPGRRYLAQGKPICYFIEGGNLYLNGTPLTGDLVLLTYFATHPVPTSETQTAFVITIPDRDLELLRLYVKAQVNIQMRGKQARLDRFDAGSGRRDDNPLMPEAINLMQDYYNKIASRITGGVIKLYRPGRTR